MLGGEPKRDVGSRANYRGYATVTNLARVTPVCIDEAAARQPGTPLALD